MDKKRLTKIVCIMLSIFTITTYSDIGKGLFETTVYASTVDKVKTLDTLEEVIRAEFNARNPVIEIQYRGKVDNMNKDTLSTIVSNILKDTYLKNSIDTWAYEVKGYFGSYKIIFNIEYRTSYEEELEVDSTVKTILSTIITEGMSTFEKVKAINDYIVLNSRYSLETNSSPHSPYTILTEGAGVCSAYASLAQKMLVTAGIESYIVEGEANELHAWNLVKIGDFYYHLDTTWNDPTEDRIGLVQYTYFLISDEDISKDHQWVREDYPSALDNSYRWMHKLKDTYTKGNTIYYTTVNGDKKSITYATYADTDVSTLPETDSMPAATRVTKVDEFNSIQDVFQNVIDFVVGLFN